MKVVQVTPGIIPIPPNGWGAVEKIIWEYKLKLNKLGVDTQIKYLNDVPLSGVDIVHIHIANLAIEAKQRGIPYVFSLHDHHVVHNGKGSPNYNQNLEAIKGSIISFCHAEYLVDFFEETDKLFYLSHGVDTEFFKCEKPVKSEHRLLCLANNGIGGDSTYDRKGFRYAIEAARALDLPITIAGPENNQHFFNANLDLLEYDKLTVILNNPDEDNIKELYNTHSIFLHPSSLEAGHPNLTLLEALSSGLPVVGTYDGSQKLDGMIVCERNTEDITKGITEIILNYEKFVDETQKTKEKYDWSVICERLLKIYETIKIINKPYNSEDTKNLYITEYKKMNKVKDKLDFIYHFVNGPYFELKGETDKTYTVIFLDEYGKEHYRENIKCNMWVRLNRLYYTKWTILLFDEDELIFNYTLDYTGKRVLISFDSSSLGDTIAWVPYVEEFRKKHNCEVICSTFKNDLFQLQYPNIKFVTPGTNVTNLHGMYQIGWFYNKDREPILPSTIPLQKTITNILGLEYSEIKPEITLPIKNRPFVEKYVTIATTSTAQLKYWNNPDGWRILCDKLKTMGYRVVHVSREVSNINGVTELKDKTLENTINAIYHSEFFIGLSSGLSWLSWAIGKKVVMISNFTEPDHEFTSNCYRVINNNVCNGCWNNPMFKFDKGDWNWCPEHKGTDRQFECHKQITPEMVLLKINELLNEN
jgi:autotransporter strand-loop-strand O-heptosyltransferase